MSERRLWVDAGNDFDYAKGKANGITAAYFDIRDPKVRLAMLRDVQSKLGAAGVFAASNWSVGVNGGSFAAWLSAKLESIAPNTPSDLPRVCVDIEKSDDGFAFVLAFLKRWRQLRPSRVTDWTLEGHKGGLFTPEVVAAVKAARVGVVPQCYNGALDQVWDTLEMARDLTRVGIPDSVIAPFMDAAHLPEWWQGYAFTQGRLP